MTSYQDNAAGQDLKKLASQLEGDLFTDFSMRLMYATDASVYREIPLAVIRPRNAEDIKKSTLKVLSWPAGYTVEEIPSGCCGMEGVMIAAPGTSCRHQIKDGTGRKALHPAEILH